jgi:hypothetical protein
MANGEQRMANGKWFLEGSAPALPKNFRLHQEMRPPDFRRMNSALKKIPSPTTG